MARSVWGPLDGDLAEHISINQCMGAKEWIIFSNGVFIAGSVYQNCSSYVGDLGSTSESDS